MRAGGERSRGERGPVGLLDGWLALRSGAGERASDGNRGKGRVGKMETKPGVKGGREGKGCEEARGSGRWSKLKGKEKMKWRKGG